MSARPAYFEPIRQEAAELWEQLESNPVLAAPWRQLFKQVQSPRHIVSELLQNADDAGASEAKVRIENDTFIFEHNGEDFTEEHFRSLCRFGYSNKRALHTIGFRGIGFKSTFSLGKRVELITPTLTVAFDHQRFTEPQWSSETSATEKFTTVRVAIQDHHRRTEVEKNLKEWLKSPVSLLFFKNIRRIQIGEEVLHWGSLGPGPVEGTEWLALHDNEDESYLIARSGLERFPEEALAEIRDERMLFEDKETDFPPCAVEIVLGAKGRLYVVLPTGVKTSLPFACNAPFIQDPARLKIKDPETSPTNRWLLNRAGRLAAEVMLKWLEKSDQHPAERARAYALMPDVDLEDTSLEGTCGTIVEKSFADSIQDQDLLLTDDGALVGKEQCIIIPKALFEVWPGGQAAALFDENGRPAFSHDVTGKDRKKLLNWGLIEEVDDEEVLEALQEKHLPKPENWHRLLSLWSYIAPIITGYRFHCPKGALRIVPVQGKDVLYAANEVVRLGEKKLVPTEEDWQFLGDRLSVVNQNWLRYLTDRRRLSELEGNEGLARQVEDADTVLKEIGLNEPSDTGKVIDRVAADFFSSEQKTLDDAIRIAQIAAKLGASTGESFRFACEDKRLRTISSIVIHDADGTLDLLLPEEWCERHLLHHKYLKSFTSCNREEWQQWIESGRAGLHTFPPLKEAVTSYMPLRDMEPELKRRSFKGPFNPRYKSPWFKIVDWDFDRDIWEHWEELSVEDKDIWGKVLEHILLAPQRYWTGATTATVTEEAQNGNTRRVIRDGLLPQWILRLRNENCLRDTQGMLRKPAELLRRTPETEALRDVEPFVNAHLDNPATAPLLELLGVGDSPTGPDKLIVRLRALSKGMNPPPHEVEKWYRRLDELLDGCSTSDFTDIKSAFENERLILTENGSWVTSAGVFLHANEEDAPGAETVRASVSDLTIWRKIGVEDRPTPELAIKWLQSLPPGQLSADDLRRARALLQRHARRVWDDCQHWLSLSGRWTPVEEFEYALTLQPLIPWSHLHQWVKDKTANLQDLPVDITQTGPFSALPLLAAHVEEKFHRKGTEAGKPETRDWLTQLGLELQRLKLKDEEEAERIRTLASELSVTKWQTTRELEIISYIDGKPAGTPRQVDAIWADDILHAEDKTLGKLARAVALELGRSFRNTDITDAIKLCFDRPRAFVTEYMEGNFTLVPREEVVSPIKEPVVDEEDTSIQPEGQNDVADEDNSIQESDAEYTDDTIEEETCEVDDDTETETPNEQEDDTSDLEDDEELVLKPRRKEKPPKPGMMERFALSEGFHKDYDSRFYDDQGNWIARANGSLFPWELRSANGEIKRHYWPKDHCLEREPLQLEAEIWSIVEKSPETYVLILANLEGEPVEITGDLLKEMQDRGELTLHPSTYRLVFEHDQGL
ncbi:MAG: ATP-binding protein [Pseudomonadales bacterium]|nr:ATP-binding protein [Pseudomonadales bacterium]